MATKDGFPNALKEALEKLPPGEQTKDAAGILINKHHDDLRQIATMPNNEKARRQHLDRLDNWLLDELAQLSDTEHDGQEHDEQPGGPQAGGAIDLPDIPPQEPPLPDIPPQEQPAAAAPAPAPTVRAGRTRPKPQ